MRLRTLLIAGLMLSNASAPLVLAEPATPPNSALPGTSALPNSALPNSALPGTPSKSAKAGSHIEDIVVTAEKRESSVQQTAISMTALSDEGLQARGIENIEDLQFFVPSLVISPNSQSPVAYAYIRGVGTDQPVAGFDPGVAYHVDGVYIGQPSSIPGDMWDLERVEVLRGPQGTLYGKNTTGGSINVITKNPSDKFEAGLDLTGGDYARLGVRGMISGPLIPDVVNGRLSFISDRNDGYQENKVGRDGDRTHYHSVRGKLLFPFGERGSLVLSAQEFINAGPNTQKRKEAFTAPTYAGALPNPSDPREIAKNLRDRLDLNNETFSARFTWDFDFARFVSITGYLNNHWYQQADIDMSSKAIQFQKWRMDTEQRTEEVQLLSRGDGPLNWIVGAFYFDESLNTDYFFQDSTTPPAGFGFHFFNGGQLDSTSWAAFAQVGYDMRNAGTPLRIVGGLRYTKDKKDIDEFQRIPDFGIAVAGKMGNQWSEVTGKVEADYFPAEQIMIYGSVSRGYKGGGFSIGQFDSYDPEKENAFEIGAKTQFWNDRAQVNLSAFYSKYDDLQVNFLTVSSLQTDNAAKATIRGIELETQFIPISNLQLGANATVLDATYDKYLFQAPTPVIGNALASPGIDLKGDTLNRAPKSTVNLNAQYTFSLGENGVLTARVDFYHQDDVYFRVQNIDRHKQGAYHRINARLAWESIDGAWSGEAFIDNIENSDDLRNLFVSDGLSTGNNTFLSYLPPRTWGVRIGWHTPH